ncbi:MAG: energy transducer TonB [Candidatus Poribacteria bacterium]|nr:energy transducer TonB [Candidatus Poribacteria bacterium]
MNRSVQFLNKSLSLSICVHLIGVAIAAISIIGTVDKHGDAIVAEFVSFPETQQIREPRRKLKVPVLTQIDFIRPQPERIRTISEAVHIPQSKTQLAIDTLPVSSVHQTTPTEIGIDGVKTLQGSLPLRAPDRGSQPIRLTSKGIPRPEWTLTPTVIASTEVSELPPVPALQEEPTQDARFFRKVDPIYPESARLSHTEGLVVLEATIGPDGLARNIKVIKVIEVGGLGCEEAAITALKASRFVPAKRGKEVVSQRLRIPYRFQFKS